MAEPKPAPEKPSLVAVPSDAAKAAQPKPEGGAKPAATQTPGQQAPEPAASAPARPAGQDAPRERKGARWGLWLLVLLVAGAAVTAWVQTQRLDQAQSRVTALSEQVLGLEAQLSAAQTQISTYEMERGQVREAVSDITERMLVLNELVGGPVAPAATPEAP